MWKMASRTTNHTRMEYHRVLTGAQPLNFVSCTQRTESAIVAETIQLGINVQESPTLDAHNNQHTQIRTPMTSKVRRL